jgi:hypothetical protein
LANPPSIHSDVYGSISPYICPIVIDLGLST